MKQSLQSTLRQSPSFTPQQQQAVKILQLTTPALLQEIKQELDVNPFLEQLDSSDQPDHTDGAAQADKQQPDALLDLAPSRDIALDIPSYAQESNASAANIYSHSGRRAATSGHPIESISAAQPSLQTHLHQQADRTPLSEREHYALDLLIDSTLDNGYLGSTLAEVYQFAQAQTDLSMDEFEAALQCLQQFEPVGVGCLDLAQCLTLQLRDLTPQSACNLLAQDITQHHLDLLGNGQLAALRKTLKVSDKELTNAIELIQSLDPSPGLQIQSSFTIYISADIIVSEHSGRWQAALNPETRPLIGLSSYTDTWLEHIKDPQQKKPLLEQVQRAKNLLSHIQSRYQTTLRVAAEIVKHQQAYFDRGPQALKPLTLKQVAEALELHISTVSRTVNGKYMLSNQGLTELKYFFSTAISSQDGVGSSARSVQAQIKQMIATEPRAKPLSDNQITHLLNDKGLQLARRTVAKYREQLNIPASSIRKHLSNP